jgi:hypothetical protein
MSELIADKAFDINNTKEYLLSIQVSLDGFYFSVTHNNRLLVLEKHPVKISSDKFLGRRFSEWLSNHDYFEKSYAGVRIICFSDKITILPGDFYSYEKQDEVINLLFGKQNSYTTQDNYWPENRCNLIFTVHEQFLKDAVQKFTECHIVHPVTAVNKKIQPYLKDDNVVMALYFDNNYFCNILYSNRELRSVNCHNYTNADDVIFYVLSILKANNISYRNTELLLAGEIGAEICNKLDHHTGDSCYIKPQVNFNPEIFLGQMHRFITIV